MLACIQQVRASSEEQSSTTAHISENIETISRVTHAAVRGNQSIASSMQELSALIEDLQHRVSAFHFETTEQPLPEIKVDTAKLTSVEHLVTGGLSLDLVSGAARASGDERTGSVEQSRARAVSRASAAPSAWTRFPVRLSSDQWRRFIGRACVTPALTPRVRTLKSL